jgi:hypothetical protein
LIIASLPPRNLANLWAKFASDDPSYKISVSFPFKRLDTGQLIKPCGSRSGLNEAIVLTGNGVTHEWSPKKDYALDQTLAVLKEDAAVMLL